MARNVTEVADPTSTVSVSLRPGEGFLALLRTSDRVVLLRGRSPASPEWFLARSLRVCGASWYCLSGLL